MKKILAHYPSVYYQVLLLFVLSEIVFSCCSFNLSPLYDLLNISAPNNYKPLAIITLYIVAGIIVDKIRDFRKGIFLATILYVIGFLFTAFGFESFQFLYLIGGIVCNLAHCIFVILCIFHVGLLFPVANDWKDMGFMLLLLFPFLLEIVSNVAKNSISHASNFIPDDTLLIFFFSTIIGLIFYCLNKFKDLGFKIEILEEEDTEDELKEEKMVRNVMIGCVLIALTFSFITKKIPSLINLQPYVNDFIYFSNRMSLIKFFVFGFSFFIFWFAYFRSSKYQSRHSQKIIAISLLLLAIGGLEYFVAARESGLFELPCHLIFYLILTPMLLSVMTHINLDKNIGLWLGVFFAMPFVVDQFNKFLYSQKTINGALPYIAVLLLVLFLLLFTGKRKFLEKELALNEPNREEDEGEEGVDILEHFIDK